MIEDCFYEDAEIGELRLSSEIDTKKLTACGFFYKDDRLYIYNKGLCRLATAEEINYFKAHYET